MPKVKLTARQEEVRDLVTARPEKSVKEIAGLLEMTEQAVYQQLSRLRSKGVLPPVKARGGKARSKARRGSRAVKVPRVPEVPDGAVARRVAAGHSVVSNGGGTVEDTVASELEKVRSRIGEIKAEQESLAQESETLGERETRLDAAQKALAA